MESCAKAPGSTGRLGSVAALLSQSRSAPVSVVSLLLAFPIVAAAYDVHFDYTSFDKAGMPGASPHFGQAQFDVLNYPSINGNLMTTSTDNHRPEMVAAGNELAQFYNNFLADYNKTPKPTATQEADAINAYATSNSTHNGPKPTWLVLNEISASLWPQNPGAPSLNSHRQWVIDCVTRLHDVYGFNVVTYAPFATVGTGSTNNGASWQALADKSYIGVENYLSGPEVIAGGSSYASRVAWAQNQYQASIDTYTAVGVGRSRLFLGEHFGNTTAGNGFGRAGISAADWDTVIQIRQDAIYNVGFAGFLAYAWGGNTMGITEAEQIQHEYYYRSRRVLPSQKPQWLSDSAVNVNGTTIPLSWSQPLNWLGGVPNGKGAEANFWRTLSGSQTITLDGNKTVGTLTFDSPYTYTISPGSGGSLILDEPGGAATLTSTQGSHIIAADVQLADSLKATIVNGTFHLDGNISGPGGLTKSGAGALELGGTNSYSDATTVQEGTLRLDTPMLADAADVYLAIGATLNLNFTDVPDIIGSLFIDGISRPTGIWGAVGSGAQFTSPLITGPGRLHITKFVASPLPGDYNQNGVVDTADYVVWRSNLGIGTSLANDDTPGVGPDDFDRWRAHFGQLVGNSTSLGLPLGIPAPEPTTWSMLLVGICVTSLGILRTLCRSTASGLPCSAGSRPASGPEQRVER